MNKGYRKFIAVVLAFAMVLSTIAVHDVKSVKAAEPDWSTVDYAGDGAGGGAYTNKYKFYSEDGKGSLVNIQISFGTEVGFYVTFPTGISSCSLTDKYAIQGAGILVYLSAFTAKVTQFTVTDATGEHTCYVYYEDGTETGETTTVDPSETTTPAVTTPTKPSAPVRLAANINDLKTNYTIAFANVTGATSYKLYIYDKETETLITEKPITNGGVGGILTIADEGLVAGKTYTFYVTALNDAGESDKSAGIDVTIPTTETESESETAGVTVVDGTELLVQTEFDSEEESHNKWTPSGMNQTTYNGDGSISLTLPAKTTGAAHDSLLVQPGITMIKGKWYKAKFTVSSDVYRKLELRVQTNGTWNSHHAGVVNEVPANGTIDVEAIFQAVEDTTVAQFGIMLGYFENGSTEVANIVISNVSMTVYNERPEASEKVTYPIGPSSVTVTAETPLQIYATWECANAPDGQTYNIYLDDSTTPFATGVTDKAYTLTGVAEGTHTVTVEAVLGENVSVKVKSASVTVKPEPVLTEVTSVSALGSVLKIEVSWECVDAPVGQTYDVYLDDNATATLTGLTGNSCTLTDVAEGTHTVTVKAVFKGVSSTGVTATTTVLGEAPELITSDEIAVEGFQIKTNGTGDEGIAFRTVCKSPNVGETIVVGDNTYTVKNMGKVFVLDTNNNGYRKNDTLDTSYTLLNPTPKEDGTFIGYKDSVRTRGFLASEVGISADWNPSDTESTYYVTTMQGCDLFVAYSIHVRAFVIAEDSEGNDTIIYGTKTATTSIAQIAYHIYGKSLAPNNTAHQYLYTAILNNTTVLSTTNPYFRNTTVVYGWDNILYVPSEKDAILNSGTLEELNGLIG